MLETAIAFYAAHLIADFALQPGWMVKAKKQFHILILHTAIVVAATAILAGTLSPWPLLVIGLAHLVIDFWKQHWGGKALAGFATDQLAHLASILLIAWLWPGTFNTAFWNQAIAWIGSGAFNVPHYLSLLTLMSGFIVSVRAGGFAVGLFMDRFDYTPAADDPGLDDGGYYIGLLERTMIFILVIIDQFAGIGFLVAAKSILRFGASQDRKTGEYVIIGTLVSFAWALTIAVATRAVLGSLAG